jgi:hypothetical protein
VLCWLGGSSRPTRFRRNCRMLPGLPGERCLDFPFSRKRRAEQERIAGVDDAEEFVQLVDEPFGLGGTTTKQVQRLYDDLLFTRGCVLEVPEPPGVLVHDCLRGTFEPRHSTRPHATRRPRPTPADTPDTPRARPNVARSTSPSSALLIPPGLPL